MTKAEMTPVVESHQRQAFPFFYLLGSRPSHRPVMMKSEVSVSTLKTDRRVDTGVVNSLRTYAH